MDERRRPDRPADDEHHYGHGKFESLSALGVTAMLYLLAGGILVEAYGRLSVMLQWRYDVEALFDVPPEAFDPPPRVDSAIVRMVPLSAPAKIDEALLSELVASAFSQRRKTLRNALAELIDEESLRGLGIDPRLRPENLGVVEYVAIANSGRVSGPNLPSRQASRAR